MCLDLNASYAITHASLPHSCPARAHRCVVRVCVRVLPRVSPMRMRMPDQGLRFAAVLRRMRMLMPTAAVVMRVAMRRMRMAVAAMVVAMIMAAGVAVPRVAVAMLAQDHEDDHIDGHAAQRQEEHHCAWDG